MKTKFLPFTVLALIFSVPVTAQEGGQLPPAIPRPEIAEPDSARLDALEAEIEAEFRAWEESLAEREAVPLPEGSQGAVQAEIDALFELGAPEHRAQIEAAVRIAAKAWTLEMPSPPLPPAEPAPEPTPLAEAEAEPAPDLLGELAAPLQNRSARPDTQVATRVLTLPGARIIGRDGVYTPPVFSILYKLDERQVDGNKWLRVGADPLRADGDGWVREEQTEEWRSMLVMQYAPLAGRNRVIFFREADDVREILRSHFYGPKVAQDLYRMVEDGRTDPLRIVAIEPERPVRSDQAPYFMPIIDFRRDEFDDVDLTPVYLLQLAAVNLKSSSRTEVDAFGQPKDIVSQEQALEDFRAGIVFVVDATLSMGPYIREVQKFLLYMRNEADRIAPGKIDFGLIGYRDNLAPDSRIGYVTRLFLPLGTPGGVAFENAVASLVPSPVSTKDWREDSFAGLQDAIEKIDWKPYNARFVILVTDAGPRAIGDVLARDPYIGARSIGRMAERRDISLQILHMKTSAGRSDHARARVQYAEAARALGDAAPRYWSFSGNTPAQFGEALRSTGREILSSLDTLAAGQRLERRTLSIDDPILQDIMNLGEAEIRSEADAQLVGQAIAEQFFVFQQEYLGRVEGEEAPDFYRAWVADRDLVNPKTKSMQVKVLVTRNQLSDLASRLSDIVRQLDEKKTGTQDAFVRISSLSGVTTYDPNLPVSAFLPEYLSELPYRSTFMNMSAEQWGNLSSQQQGEILNAVRDRIRLLEEINSSAFGWLPLPGRSGGEEVYPLDLDDLP